MTYAHLPLQVTSAALCTSDIEPRDPRFEMFMRLPRWIQPFLTWLTARPAPGEAVRERGPSRFVVSALVLVLGGIGISGTALECALPGAYLLVVAGVLLTTSGLGVFQVVIFHHCSHGTVFRNRKANVTVGRLISSILLFKHFDLYRHEHMLHHSPKKLLTADDEFADFVFGLCGLHAGMSRKRAWFKVLTHLVSPWFHLRFMVHRIRAALLSSDWRHNLTGCVAWSLLAGAAAATGQSWMFVVVWVLPVTVLLQAATVFRILCEHRFPEQDLLAARGRDFACHATSGVFPGARPPGCSARSARGLVRWCAWWANMLLVQLPVRIVILVGDAPCHDFHHRRPASRLWTSYVQARQRDQDAGSPGFNAGYSDTWGLFRAIDLTLESLARMPADFRP